MIEAGRYYFTLFTTNPSLLPPRCANRLLDTSLSMSFSKISALAGVVALASQAAAHGLVTGIVADGIYYAGYDMDSQYESDPAESVGWAIPTDLGRGPITPDEYATSDIICHLNATNAQLSAPVSAGGSVELQWTAWPSSHHGPVIGKSSANFPHEFY